MSDDLTDDQITDRIAAEVVARIADTHPAASPAFRRLLVRLYTLQAVGHAPQPGQITNDDLGQHLQLDPRRISETCARGLARAWHTYQTRFPHLL
jgi:hypothetical protein